ncbi:MAG: anthranilate synthase component I family protein [Myxococcales bacterium]|nr:anthranilate synthase component I family protein [Myxococcales bacterium]
MRSPSVVHDVGPRDAERVALALRGRPGLAWLDGDGRSEAGRWSFLACDPVERIEVRFGEPWLDALGRLGVDGAHAEPSSVAAIAPRWIGWIAYDAAWSHDAPGPRRLRRERARPVVRWLRYDAVVALDGSCGRAWVVGDDEAAAARLHHAIERPGEPPRARANALHVTPASEHRSAVAAAREAIARGDVYQVNLARCWRASFEGEALAVFLTMRRASPVPLGFFLDAGPPVVLGRSMECFLRWEGPGRRLETRPIKGTVARAGPLDDARIAEQLRADPKERAEHVMIVDMARNDLGRVAETGTVRVERPLEVEPYARLSHMVSTVACVTRREVRAADVMAATFPPASVTGAPKRAAIQHIEALEPVARGVYCGALGMVTRAGVLHLAVAIRTAQCFGDELVYHAGGGIVFDSDPDREIAETELKARVFLDALATLSS